MHGIALNFAISAQNPIAIVFRKRLYFVLQSRLLISQCCCAYFFGMFAVGLQKTLYAPLNCTKRALPVEIGPLASMLL